MRKLRNTKFTAGFTLIELLVVIAIIGILSSIILTSLGSSRNKAKDSAVQSDLGSLRAQAEIYSSDHGGYTALFAGNGVCTTSNADSSINNVLAKVISDAGGAGNTICNVASDGTAYAVSAKLQSQASAYWCIDASGKSAVQNTALGVGVVSCN